MIISVLKIFFLIATFLMRFSVYMLLTFLRYRNVFGYCVISSSSIYGFWLPFGIFKLFLQTIQTQRKTDKNKTWDNTQNKTWDNTQNKTGDNTRNKTLEQNLAQCNLHNFNVLFNRYIICSIAWSIFLRTVWR